MALAFVAIGPSGTTWAQSQAPATSKLYGEIALTTDSIEHGISTSENSVALQPEIGYQWAQARLGLFGSNVQYPSNTESLNLRPTAWYRILINANIDLKAEYQLDTYFKSANRNGNILIGDLNLFTHHIIVEQDSNWYATGTPAYWLAYVKSWKTFWDLDYELTAGYMLVNASAYNSYLDVVTGFAYKINEVWTELLLNYNSNASQFTDGIATPALFLRLSVKF